MATVNGQQVWSSKRVSTTKWTPMLTTDVGTPETCGRLSDRSVQVIGTLGAGGSVNIQGSNDGSTWATLNDPASVPLATMGVGIKEILENTQFVRPVVVGGDGTTSITVILTAASTA